VVRVNRGSGPAPRGVAFFGGLNMDIQGFFGKTLFKVDGLTFSILGVLVILIVLWFLFLRK
jgi:hypothetical protein